MVQYVIEILDGDRAGEVVSLPEGRLRIGRKADNDLVLTDEKTSGSHAEIVHEQGSYVLRDLDSTNGTSLDGRRITEVVLTAGDVFSVGRVRLLFRSADAPSGADGFSVNTLDRSRLGRARNSRSVGALGALLVLVVCAGLYLWWQRRGEEERTAGAPRPRAALVVPGNKLSQAAASCEDEGAWELDASGIPMQVGDVAATGRGALEAVRSTGAGSYALARSKEVLTVVAGRALSLRAQARTRGSAKACARLRFLPNDERLSLPCVLGTALAQGESFATLSCEALVPAGYDRVQVEVLACLPHDGDAAWFDDVALLEGGQGSAFDLQCESGGRAIGSAGHLSVQSGVPVLFGIAPRVDGELSSCADELVLSDLGQRIEASKTDLGFEFGVQGASGIELLFPAQSGRDLLAAKEDGRFESVAAESSFGANSLLLGTGQARCLVEVSEATRMAGRMDGGLYRLQVAAPRFALILQFRSQRDRALELLARAREVAETAPGEALRAVQRIAQEVPHDDRVLAEARQLRLSVLERLGLRIRDLRADYEESLFFKTRGGFRRVVDGIEDVLRRYGEENVEDAEALKGLLADAAAKLKEIDDADWQKTVEKLELLASALAEAKQEELEKLVRDYIERH